jgi:hypothetical protein
MKIDWYKHIWTLDIKNQSWTEDTEKQVEFIVKTLTERPRRIGRYSLWFIRLNNKYEIYITGVVIIVELLIQHIKIEWSKICRGAPYSTARSQMLKSYFLPKDFLEYNSPNFTDFPFHYINFSQSKEGFKEKFNRIDTISEHGRIRIGAVEAIKNENFYDVRYRADFHVGGKPIRCKMNQLLNETAVHLFLNEYGRIIYNARYTDFDTGNWWYELDVINLLYICNDRVLLDVFSAREPDKTYKQIAVLR